MIRNFRLPMRSKPAAYTRAWALPLALVLPLLALIAACARGQAPTQTPVPPAPAQPATAPAPAQPAAPTARIPQAQAPAQSEGNQAPAQVDLTQKWSCFFTERGVKGTFALSSSKNTRVRSSDPARAVQRYLPASTFKIVNSLIGLETGVVVDGSQLFVWDGKQREFPAWNQNHTLLSAFQNSVVPVYQKIASQIGQQRMQHWVDTLHYGNQDISGGKAGFWLDGGLRISATEQIELLSRLHNQQLPLSDRTQRIVVDIMKMEQSDNYVLRGKTGWVAATEPQLGWWVGWLEMKRETLYFALNMDIMKRDDLPLRKQIGLSILESETQLGAVPKLLRENKAIPIS